MKALKVVREVPAAWSPGTTDFWTAASAHVFISLFVVTAAAYLFPGSVSDLFRAVGGLLAFVIVKEYGVDPRLEAGADIQSGTVDFAFYMVGLVLALLLIAGAHAFLGRPW